MTEITNFYKVPKKQWKRWSPLAQDVFNTVYDCMLEQSHYTHPKAVIQIAEYWKTTVWNAAWTAADAVCLSGFNND